MYIQMIKYKITLIYIYTGVISKYIFKVLFKSESLERLTKIVLIIKNNSINKLNLMNVE